MKLEEPTVDVLLQAQEALRDMRHVLSTALVQMLGFEGAGPKTPAGRALEAAAVAEAAIRKELLR